MSDLSHSGRKKTMDLNMKSQIVAMLKNVIDDENTEKEFEDEIKASIFAQDDNEEEDDTETQSNTTMSNIEYSRVQLEKSQTTKIPVPFKTPKEKEHDCFIDSSQFSRKTERKFQTMNMQNIPLFIEEPQSLFYTNPMNNFRINPQPQLQCQPSPQLFSFGYPMMPVRFINKTNTSNGYPHQKMPMKQTASSNEEYFFNDLETIIAMTNRFDHDTYMKLQGYFIQITKNQQTSRIAQVYLEQTPNEIIHLIFEELKDQIAQLLLDPYANYFCLKLFYYLNQNDRIEFLKNATELFDVLSVNKISTYPIQCIIGILSQQEEKRLIANAAYKCLMKLAIDTYGTHVLEKILTCFEHDLIKPISLFIIDNFYFLANNANGLCIIKKEIILEKNKCNYDRLKQELVTHALVLIQNPYGNYALQTAIDYWDASDTEEIMMQFVGKCSILSIQKYSSNVIERCIEKSDKFLSAFIGEVYMNACTMSVLMKNNYGNYVIQTALKSARPNNKLILINFIQSNLDRINDKKLISKWNSILTVHSRQCTGKEN